MVSLRVLALLPAVKQRPMILLHLSTAMVVLIGALSAPANANAQSDPYHITPSEKAACTQDAERLCARTYPDEQKMLGCMLTNKASLTPGCLVVFNAGMKRRHLGAR